MTPEALQSLIRTIPDFPKPGILFRDVTTLIGHGEGFAASVALLAQRAQGARLYQWRGTMAARTVCVIMAYRLRP
jgi:adenine/guanine phosphoribosyltransferase-like PRPP-binding protein